MISENVGVEESVAVVVPTYNRKEKLIKCINSILWQDYKDFVIVIIDDNSDQAVSPSWFIKGPVKVIRNSFRLTKAATRNKAIQSVKADIFILLDDDCWLEDIHWIKKHVEANRDFPKSLIGGRIVNISDSWAGWVRAMLGDNGIQFNFLQTMNMSFRKSIFDEIGGFNENFNELEDVDFSQRALKKGFLLKYRKDIVCYHKGADSFLKILKRQREYGLWSIPVRKIQRYDGHWLLPANLFSSFLVCIPLSTLITIRQIIMNINNYPHLFFFMPIVWIYNFSYSLGIVRYYLYKYKDEDAQYDED